MRKLGLGSIRNTQRRKSALLAVAFLTFTLVSSLGSVLLSAGQQAAAAGSNIAGVTMDIPSFGGGGVVTGEHTSTQQCSFRTSVAPTAFFNTNPHDNTDFHTALRSNILLFDKGSPQLSSSDLSAAHSAFDRTRSGSTNLLVVGDGGGNCNTLMFVQAKTGSNTFYGVVPNTHGNPNGWHFDPVKGSVNNSGAFSFTDSVDGSSVSLTLLNFDPAILGSTGTTGQNQETFTWQDKTHIAITGGISGTQGGTLTAVTPSASEISFQGILIYVAQGCEVGLKATVSSSNTSLAAFSYTPTGTTSGGPASGAAYCTDAQRQPLTSRWINVTIHGNRDAVAAGQAVDFTLWSPKLNGDSPNSVSFIISGTGSTKYSGAAFTLNKSYDDTNSATTSIDKLPAYYKTSDNLAGNIATQHLKPGTYQACDFPSLLACKNFTKGATALSFDWGAELETADQKVINVSYLQPLDPCAGGTHTLTGGAVSLYNAAGTSLLHTVTFDTSTGTITSCAGTVTIGRSAAFQNIGPGSYLVCLGTAATISSGDAADKSKCSSVKKDAGSSATADINGVDNTTGGPTDPASDTPTCESSGFSLSWIMCPIINGLASAVDGTYHYFIQPLLQTSPIVTTANGDPTNIYKIWSNFRIYGDIFLVIALLVIVFGQSLGGGAIDAYTAKKVLPRLLIAAILINLSIYIVALLVDITNIIGGGIQTLLTQPFQDAGQFSLKLSGGTSATLAVGGVASLAALVGGIWGLVAATAATLAILGPLIQFVLLFILLPAFLTFIAILVTVLIRRGLIIFLVVVSPVAFALYCLPNTEQYFRKWWDLLFKTLLVYPIIAVVFAVANIMSVTIGMAGQTSGFLSWVAQLMSVAALIIPLFLIPFAFRIAGGVIGKAHEVATSYHKRGQEALKGNVNDPNSLRNKTKRNAGSSMVRTRALGVGALGSYSMNKENDSFGRKITRRGAGFLGKRLNYGDLESKQSALIREAGERRETKTGSGPDDSVRAFFATKDKDGIWRSRTTGNQYSEIDVAKARQLYGSTPEGLQTALDYELGKAEPEQYEKMTTDAAALLSSRGMTDGEVNGAMKGVGYKNQAKYLDLKHSSFEKDKDGNWTRNINHAALARNAAVDFGSYPISNMKPAPIQKLAEAHRTADDAITSGNYSKFKATTDESGAIKRDENGNEMNAEWNARKTRDDVESTAATLDMSARYGGRSQQGEAEGGVPLSTSGAPGRVDQEINKLVNQVNSSQTRRGVRPATPTQGTSTPPAPPGGWGPQGPPRS